MLAPKIKVALVILTLFLAVIIGVAVARAVAPTIELQASVFKVFALEDGGSVIVGNTCIGRDCLPAFIYVTSSGAAQTQIMDLPVGDSYTFVDAVACKDTVRAFITHGATGGYHLHVYTFKIPDGTYAVYLPLICR